MGKKQRPAARNARPRPVAPAPVEARVNALASKKSFFLSNNWLFGSMAVCSALALVVSFILSIDAWKIAADPGIVLGCDISKTVSCGTVARTWQAHLVGFPNAFWGILFESVVLCVAVAKLMGSKFSRLFMFFLQLFYTCAIIFALWLFYQSAFNIHAFCPWCLVITLTTIIEWFDLFRVNMRDNGLYMPDKIRPSLEIAVRRNFDMLTGLFIILVVVTIIFTKYGSQIFS